MKITLELDLTLENIEKLKALCGAPVVITEKEGPMKVKKLKADNPPPAEQTTPAGGADSGTAQTTETEKVSLTDVRAVALNLSKAGKQDELKAAFAKFGGKKLSDIKEADYAALLAELNSGGAE